MVFTFLTFVRTPSYFRTDLGANIIATTVKAFLASEGTSLMLACKETPQQIGNSERLNYTLMDDVRGMSKLPNIFWGGALKNANYPRNHTMYHEIIPYAVWYNTNCNVSHLRSFGEPCFVRLTKNEQLSKLNARAKQAIFVGYDDHSKAYRCIDPTVLSSAEMSLSCVTTASISPKSPLFYQARPQRIPRHHIHPREATTAATRVHYQLKRTNT